MYAPPQERCGARLNEQGWAAAWAEGQAMTPEQAVAYVLEQDVPA